MDLHSAMETFAEAWVAANTQTPLTDHGTSNESQVIPSHGAHDASSAERIFANLTASSNRLVNKQEENALKAAAAQAQKSMPVHCLIEQVPQNNQHQANGECSSQASRKEIDTYAIISTSTLFSDIVKTALIKLGYSTNEACSAKGSLQIRNWNPMSFEAITSSLEATVGDIIGHLSSVVTLRIKLFRIKKTPPSFSSTALEMKEKLLQILLAQSHSLLLNEGCPIDQQSLFALTSGCINGDIPLDLLAKFEQWYQQQICKLQQQFLCATIAKTHENLNPHEKVDSCEDVSDCHISNNDCNRVRTRLRTSFDTELELPLLNKWFKENPHPSRCQIQQYVSKLNSLESRKDRKALDVNNVVYWFKNARAAHKRAEQQSSLLNKGNEENHGQANKLHHSFVKPSDLSQLKSDSENESCGQVMKENHSKSEAIIDGDDIIKTNDDEMKRDFPFTSIFNPGIYKTHSFGISQSINKLDGEVALGIYDLGRRKRNRTFIDPVSEVPVLERWFCLNTHPSIECISRYTVQLNHQPYRLKFPKLEPKNVQFWFKNRRAKSKRLKINSESS